MSPDGSVTTWIHALSTGNDDRDARNGLAVIDGGDCSDDRPRLRQQTTAHENDSNCTDPVGPWHHTSRGMLLDIGLRSWSELERSWLSKHNDARRPGRSLGEDAAGRQLR